MRGFFELDTPKLTKPKANKKLGCEACGLYKQVKSPRMPYTGEGRLGAFILSEAPGETEDRMNKQLIGKAGQLLRRYLAKYGLDLDKDFWKQNSVRCRPTDGSGNNRTPTKEEIQCCEQLWRKDIATLKPKYIFLLGAKAIEAFFQYRSHPISSDLSMGRWASQCIPDSVTGAWVICLYHPSFAVRNPDFENKFDIDLEWGLRQLERKPPEFPDWTKNVLPVTKFELVMGLLEDILETDTPIVIDYETSGIRPYAPGHHIWSIGIYLIGDDCAYSFPYQYPNHWKIEQLADINGAWCDILQHPNIPKIAQSIQMEESWGRRIVGAKTLGWLHDTMVCSHVLNEHRKITSLDFQVFVNWGYEYGEEITPFKKARNEEGFNRMHEVPLLKLLEYNGLDTLFTGMLEQKQVEELNERKSI